MEVEILESSKNEIKAKLENITIAEILRVYLNKDSGVSFVAWKREHPTEKPVLLLKTKGKTAKMLLLKKFPKEYKIFLILPLCKIPPCQFCILVEISCFYHLCSFLITL